jgi:hypothetical protein
MNRPNSLIRLLAAALALALLPAVPRAAVAQAPAPAPSLRSAQVDPSGELLILKYGTADGTPDNITSVSGTATLTRNGTPIALSRWLHARYGWLAFALCDDRKYAKVVDDEDRGEGVIVTSGAWTTAVNGVAGDNFGARETAVGDHFLRSSDPAAGATYTFKGCVPGPHRLYHMLWDRMEFDRTPDAVYTVKSGGGAALGTFHVDLKYTGSNPMWPRFDLARGGYDWTTVGEVTLPAGEDTVIVEVANGAAGTLVVDGMLLRNVLVPRAGPGDALALDMAAGVVTTASGPQPAVVARPITVATDVDLMPVDPTRPRTLKAGYNKEGDNAGGPALLAADRGPTTWGWRPVTGNDSVTLDDRGELTAMTGQAFRRINAADYNYVDGRMILRVPDGQKFRLEFDYAGDFNAGVKAGQTFRMMQGAAYTKDTSVNGDGYEHLGGTRWRLWVTFHHSPWTPSSVGYPFLPWGMHDIDFQVRHPITHFSMFDDRTPVDWPHYTHPTTYGRYRGKGVDTFRLMDAMGTNHSPIVDWTDYYPEDATGRDVLPYRYEQPVLSVEPVDRSDADADRVLPWFANANYNCVVKVTVGSTAGLVDGHTLQFSNDGQTIPADAAVRAGNPGALCYLTQPIVVVLNPTQLLVSVFMNGSSPGPSASTCAAGVHTLAPGTTLYASRPAQQHPRAAARVCAELGISPWYNIPHLASDRYVRDWADMALSVHPAGTKIRVEYSNEIWNFPMHVEYVSIMTRHANHLHDLDPVANPLTFNNGFAWGAWNSDRLRQVALAKFKAAGREADLYWILGTQTGNPGATTQPMVAWGATQTPPVKLHFDALALESYVNFGTCLYNELVTSDADVNAFYDRLSITGGQISLASCTVLDGGRAWVNGVHRDLLDRHGFEDTEIVSYEGGWDWLAYRGTVDVNEPASQEISRSPRMYRLTTAEWEMCDRAGLALRCRYAADYVAGVQGKEVWCDFPWIYCTAGTGDPAENPHPWDYDGTAFGVGRPVVSQMGGALLDWAAGTMPPPAPATGPVLRTWTVRFVASPGPVSDHLVTIRDAAGVPVPGLDRRSAGGPLADNLSFQVGPGTYTATVEAVNLVPDAAHPVYSEPAVSVPFTVPAPPNARPPAPTGVVVTGGAAA